MDLQAGGNQPGRKHRPGWEAQKARAMARRERMLGAGLAAIGSVEKLGLGAGNGKCAVHPTADHFDSVRRMAHEEAQRQPPGGSSRISLSDGSADAVTSMAPAPRRSAAEASCLPQQKEPAQAGGRLRRAKPACGDAGPQQSYADMLSAQIAEKRALKEAERQQHRSADSADDARVEREAAELRSQVVAEVDRQRQREATVRAREDSLSRFMADNGGHSLAGDRAAESVAATAGSMNETRAESPPVRRPKSSRGGCPPLMPSQACAADAYLDKRQQVVRRASPFATNEDAENSSVPTQARRESPFAINEECRAKASGGRVSSNVWATGANQNCGNMISDRATSRVLRPPGGGSSFQLGAW